MFTNTKFIMLSIFLAAGHASASFAVPSIPAPTTAAQTVASSSAVSTVTYITPTYSAGIPSNSGFPFGGSNVPSGGSPGGALPSGSFGHNGGPNGTAPGGGVPSGFPNHGGSSSPPFEGSSPSGISAPEGISPGGALPSGFPGSSSPFGRPFPRNIPRQFVNQPFSSSGSQSSDITTADNSTFLPYTVAYYAPPFTVRGLSTVHNSTQGQELVEFIETNGGERNGDWWKVSTADFVSHIQNYTMTIGGTVYVLTALGVQA